MSTNEEKSLRIYELQAEKRKLLDMYGVFGGGQEVNEMHRRINLELELLGVSEND